MATVQPTYDQIMAAASAVVAQMGQSDLAPTDAVLANPLAALNAQLSNAGNPTLTIPTDGALAFTTGIVAQTPVTPQLDIAKRSGGPDSWNCFLCYYGAKAVMYGLITGAGIALASNPALVLASADLVAWLAATMHITTVAVTGLLSGFSAIGIDALISKLAKYICEAIPNTCSAPKPYTGLWTMDKELGWQSTAAPALTPFYGGQAMLHRGNDNDHLWWGVYSPVKQTWEGDTPVTDFHIVGQPAATTALGIVQAYYRVSTDNNIRVRTSSDLTNWTPEVRVPVNSTVTPAVDAGFFDNATNQTGILCASADDAGNLVASGITLNLTASTAGLIFSQAVGHGAATTQAPAIEFFNGMWTIAYTDKATGGVLAVTSADGRTWSAPVTVGSSTAIGGPALATLGASSLYFLYTSTAKPLCYTVAQIVSGTVIWTPEQRIDGHLSSAGPALAVQGSTLIAAHRGRDDKHPNIYWTTAQP